MTDDVFAIDGDAGHREAALHTYLDPISDERATVDAIVWIKSLRQRWSMECRYVSASVFAMIRSGGLPSFTCTSSR